MGSTTGAALPVFARIEIVMWPSKGWLAASVADTGTVKSPAVVGVPEIVALLETSPPGNGDPIVNVTGGAPLVPAKVYVKGVPTLPCAVSGLVIVIACGTMVSVRVLV